jgi:hypothetical protein
MRYYLKAFVIFQTFLIGSITSACLGPLPWRTGPRAEFISICLLTRDMAKYDGQVVKIQAYADTGEEGMPILYGPANSGCNSEWVRGVCADGGSSTCGGAFHETNGMINKRGKRVSQRRFSYFRQRSEQNEPRRECPLARDRSDLGV